jgi:protein archease
MMPLPSDDRPGARAEPAPAWEHFAHGADIGVRGTGPTLAAAFEHAALALTGVMCSPGAVRPVVPVTIACEAPSHDLLLVDWLNALVFEMATRHLLFGHFQVQIDGPALKAVAWGERVDPVRHQPAVEVKGATHTALHVGQQPDGLWVAECVVDV